MGTLTVKNQLTLLELAKRMDPNGDMSVIAEVLDKNNEFFQDAMFLEANGQFYHKTTKRLTLPTGTWRKFNEGVSSESSLTTEVTEGIGMLDSMSKTDSALIKLATDPVKARNDEARAFIKGLGLTIATTFCYGNANIDAEKFTGLAPRNATLNTVNTRGCSGTGSDLTSAYIIEWGIDTVHMIYPKGHKTGGVERIDKGEQLVRDANNKEFLAMVDYFMFHTGLVVKDDRAVQRVCNIETTGSSNLLDDDILLKAINSLPMMGRNAVIYVNRTLKSQLDILAKDKTNVNYSIDNIFGMPVTSFRGVPVRMLEAIVDTEDQVS